MARSLLENPNFSWATWNPTTWGDTVVDTPAEDTPPGITSIYPYLPTGGGTGGDNITPIMPRETDPFAFEDIRALAARGATGAQGIAEDDENWFQKQVAFFRDKYPNWATPVGIINALTGRKDATQSFAGGPDGVGSIAGLYQSEVDLLNELRQAGFLVDTPGGVKTTSGKNPVSLLGGYEEGQEETYQAIIDRYGPNALDILTKKYGKNAAIVNRFKEAEFIVKRNEAAKQKAIDKMKLTYRDDVHPGTTTKQVTAKPTVEETAATEMITTPTKTVSVPVPRHISHGGDGGYQGTGRAEAQSNYGGGWDDGYWAKGGLIRKKYGDGGIVGLL